MGKPLVITRPEAIKLLLEIQEKLIPQALKKITEDYSRTDGAGVRAAHEILSVAKNTLETVFTITGELVNNKK